MSAHLHVTVDPSAVPMAASIRAAAQAAALLCPTGRTFGDLAEELGSMEAAAESLLTIAEEIGYPIAVNIATGASTSKTVFIPPKGWGEARLAGWAAGHHQALEGEFGEVARVGATLGDGVMRRNLYR